VQTGPTSWFQAVLNAPNNTITLSFLTVLPVTTPWLVVGGNADAAFSADTGAWTAPITGVYEIVFNAVVGAIVALENNSIFILVNGVQKFLQISTAAGIAAASTLNVAAVFALNKGDVVQVAASTSSAGTCFQSSILPEPSPNVFYIKSLF
jgi:hypothetical protein